MNKVINGKMYDTNRGRRLADRGLRSRFIDCFRCHESLYRMWSGEYFLFREGEPGCKDAVEECSKKYLTQTIIPITEKEARDWARAYCGAYKFICIFGYDVEAIETLDRENGSFTYDGAKYVLLVQAYGDGGTDERPAYCAKAIRTDECTPDEITGYIQEYDVVWYVPDSTLERWRECEENGDYVDSGDDCDWDYPDIVRPG